MIYIQIWGGLGNQMFQLAAAIALAKAKKTSVGICLERINQTHSHIIFTKREFELERVFDISDFRISKRDHCNYIIAPDASILQKLRRRLKKASFLYEKTLEYDETFQDLTKECYLEGYFQSYRYFEAHRSLIKRTFNFRQKPSTKTSQLITEIRNKNAIAIHVRRGDFVKYKSNLEMHGVCSVEYYLDAVKLFNDQEGICFVIVSDDADWVKCNLSFGHRTYHVDWNSGSDSWQDMLIISKCKHAIIANSSFSWWGAYLIDSPGKKIVAPRIWYADKIKQEQTKDLIPSEWLRI